MQESFDEQLRQIYKNLLEYAELGLPIIPCREKSPILKNWTNRGVPTREEIRKWINRRPIVNIGLVLGTASEIVAIDVDGATALKRLKELSAGDLPKTWSFPTPGGGLRYLYKLPQGITAKKYNEKFEGDHSALELLGDGQQTLLPPSIHPNGKQYRWAKGRSPNEISLALAPQWLLKLMSNNKSTLLQQTPDKALESCPPQQIFDRLLNCCEKFGRDMQKQQEEGLWEDQWFLWITLLTAAGHPDTARVFSELSKKHTKRSIDRLEELARNKINSPMIRCTKFGCTTEQIKTCFNFLNTDTQGEVRNSPGRWIKNMPKVEIYNNPDDAAYKPYLEALSKTSDYTVDDHGNLCIFNNKGKPRIIANFVARPVCELIRDDGQTTERTFRIEGILHSGKQLPTIDIEAENFVNMTWPLKHWGVQANMAPHNKEAVRHAIQSSALKVPEHRVYTHLGWRKEPHSGWIYLHSGGAIGADNVSVEIHPTLARYSLPPTVPDYKKAAKASLKFLKIAPYHVTIPLLALVYLAPLVEFFKKGGLEPNFVCWLYGGTGTRKTSLAMILLCHFGKFVAKNPPASFKDTANALEVRAFATKDSLLVIDDFHPESNKRESYKMAQTAQRVLRMYGDRVGRGRLTSTIQLQNVFPPRGMALVTGEDFPAGQSSVARFLGIELREGDVDLEVLSWYQANCTLLAQAMVGYLQWLIPQIEGLPERLKTEFHCHRGNLQQKATHGRLEEAAAWLLVAFSTMTEFMVSVKALKQEKADRLNRKALKVMQELVERQNLFLKQEQPADIFVKALYELFIASKVSVQPIDERCIVPDLYSTGVSIGWIDEEYLYLLPDVSYNAVSRFLQARGEVFPVKSRTLWRHLDEAQLLYTAVENNERRRLVKKVINENTRVRLLHVYRTAFETKCQN